MWAQHTPMTVLGREDCCVCMCVCVCMEGGSFFLTASKITRSIRAPNYVFDLPSNSPAALRTRLSAETNLQKRVCVGTTWSLRGNRGSSREMECCGKHRGCAGKDRSKTGAQKSIRLQFLKDSFPMRVSSHQPLGWASVWPQQERAPPPEITLLLAEGYKGKKINMDGRREQAGGETVMERWKANLYQLLFYVSLSPPSHVYHLKWALSRTPFLSSEEFGINTSQLHEKRRNCNISHLPHSIPVHPNTHTQMPTHSPKSMSAHTSTHPHIHTWSSSKGVNNYFAKGHNCDPRLVFKALSLNLNHPSSPSLPLVKWKCPLFGLIQRSRP